MDIRIQSALLASIVGLSLGFSMLLRPGRPRVHTLYALLALTIGGFYLAQFFYNLFALGTNFPWLLRVAMGARLILGALIPSAALAFFLEFLGSSRSGYKYGQRIALLSAVLGLAVGLTPLSNEFWARVAVTVWIFGALFASVSLVIRRRARSDSPTERARLMYLAWGAAGSLLFSALDQLVDFGIPVPPLGPLAATLYLFFLAQTLLRLRLLDLHELLGKIASQTVLAAILAGVFSVLTAWVQHNWSLFLFNTVVAAFVILILIEPLRAKVEERVVAIFFRERFQLLRSLSSLRNRMSTVIDVNELATLVLGAIHETRRVTHASIYLLADDRPGFRLLDCVGPQPALMLDASAARGLLTAANSGQKAVLLENLDRRLAEVRTHPPEGKRTRDELRRLNDVRAALVQMKAGISVPLSATDRVLGFLNLWDERVPEAYASDEIALILEIGERLATAIENSKLYDRMRERDRLAALGEMAAGLAHEIRNPLGAIKGAAQCLDPKRLPGEDGEFLEVIVEEVNRLNGVVTAFLDYARPLKQNFGKTDMNEVVSRTVRLIQNEIPPNIELKEELAEPLNKIDGDAEQLKQVLINLVQNSIHAIGQNHGRITIRTLRHERFSDFRGSTDSIEVQIQDNGPGIPTDHQPHIFVPFFTTKLKGTGLGLAICQRIVKNHGGTITLQSRSGEGTNFIIRLPALPSEVPAGARAIAGTPSPDSISGISSPLQPTTPEPAEPGLRGSRPRAAAKKSRRAV